MSLRRLHKNRESSNKSLQTMTPPQSFTSDFCLRRNLWFVKTGAASIMSISERKLQTIHKPQTTAQELKIERQFFLSNDR
jgi:hypothetical protein